MDNITLEEAFGLLAEAERLSPAERAGLQFERLNRLVAYVRSHSPYFRELYSSLGQSPGLSDLPGTEKKELLSSFDHWVTDPEITWSSVNAYLADADNSGRSFLEKYTVLTTSGTTGDPMPLVRGAYRNTIHAAMIQRRLLNGVDPQLMNPAKSRIASVIATGAFVSSYAAFERIRKQDMKHAHNLLAISAWDPTDRMVAQLNAFEPDTLTGYPSVLAVLALERQQGRLKIKPQMLACSAETLTPEAYSLLTAAFGCPVLNNYCSTEGGEAAMSCPLGKLHVNEDWVILEPVDSQGRAVPMDTLSEGVLVTDLTNYVQPIIRYKMDDRVCIRSEPCSCGNPLPVLEISGRGGDQLELCGRAIASVRFAYLMEHEVQGALLFQFVQTGPDRLELRYTLLEGVNELEYRARVAEKVHKIFADCGCHEAQFAFSQEPPRVNRRGGKLKSVVKEWTG